MYVLFILHHTTFACPPKCRCIMVYVKCTDITQMELMKIPKETVSLVLHKVPSLKELPPNLFILPNLRSLDLNDTSLERLFLADNVPLLRTLSISGGRFKDYLDIHIEVPLKNFILKSMPVTFNNSIYSFRNAEYLFFENTSIKTFNSSLFNLSDVTSIIFKGNPLNSITFGESSTTLSYSQITQCALTNLEHIKVQTKSLKVLNLDRNKIKSPVSHIDFRHLQVLSLDFNNITEFNSAFFNLSNLERLEIDGNPLVELHLELPNLLHLYASFTSLKVLNTSAFKTPRLSYMRLEQSNISYLDLSRGIERVRYLHLYRCKISEFYSSQYKLPSIEMIDLRYNPLSYIDLSDGLQNLRELHLDHCNLTVLDLRNANMSSIEVLIINGNPLAKIDFRSDTLKLKTFEAKYTNITNFDLTQCNLPSLTSIKLNGSPLTNFNLASAVPKLERLSLCDTKLDHLYLSQTHLPELSEIYLDKSPITSLHLALGVETLKLRYTNLTFFDTQRVNCSMLRNLDLSSSPIQAINIHEKLNNLQTFTAKSTKLLNFNPPRVLPRLTHLILSKTPLRKLDLSRLPNLKFMYADSANLSEFNSSGFHLPYIKRILLNNNPLRLLDIRYGLEQVKNLDLKNTSLTRFDKTIANLPNLNMLQISGKFLESIDLSHFPKLKSLFLRGTRNLKKIYFDRNKSTLFERLYMDPRSMECDCEWLGILKRNYFEYFKTHMCKGWQPQDTVFSFSYKLGCSPTVDKPSDLPKKINKRPITESAVRTTQHHTPTTFFPWGLGKYIIFRYKLSETVQNIS